MWIFLSFLVNYLDWSCQNRRRSYLWEGELFLHWFKVVKFQVRRNFRNDDGIAVVPHWISDRAWTSNDFIIDNIIYRLFQYRKKYWHKFILKNTKYDTRLMGDSPAQHVALLFSFFCMTLSSTFSLWRPMKCYTMCVTGELNIFAHSI